MRDAPSLVIVPALRDAGAEFVLCDPQGRKEGEGLLGEAEWVERSLRSRRECSRYWC